MNKLSFRIRTLTPIVTGDYEQSNNKIIATGLLGSLRYQYWLLKALTCCPDGKPTDLPLIETDGLESYQDEAGLHRALLRVGPVNQLFGCTGWKRLFRLQVSEADSKEKIEASARFGKKAARQWEFILTFRQDRDITALVARGWLFSLEQEIKTLMAFVHDYGWLGAAPQNGFGWVKVQPLSETGEDGAFSVADKTILGPSNDNNQIFWSRDICLDSDESEKTLKKLQKFYQGKYEKAKNNQRYVKSVEYTESFGNPLGYEIRRWLKAVKPSSFRRLFGTGGAASFIQITHPVVDTVTPDAYKLRIRCCARFGNSLDCSAKKIVDWCLQEIPGT